MAAVGRLMRDSSSLKLMRDSVTGKLMRAKTCPDTIKLTLSGIIECPSHPWPSDPNAVYTNDKSAENAEYCQYFKTIGDWNVRFYIRKSDWAVSIDVHTDDEKGAFCQAAYWTAHTANNKYTLNDSGSGYNYCGAYSADCICESVVGYNGTAIWESA